MFWLGLGASILIATYIRAILLDRFPLSPDEGIHLIWLRLLSEGYSPYSEVYITYPPLYPLAIDLVWQWWPTEAAQRWFSVIYTMFGAIGVALLARKFAGGLAAIIATLLLLFSPPLFEASRGVLGEFPSVAWSIWAIWFIWLYRDAPHSGRLYLVLSGLCFAASLLTKFLSPFLIGFIPLVLISKWILVHWGTAHRQEMVLHTTTISFGPLQIHIADLRQLFRDLVIWTGAFVLTIVIVVVIFDAGAFFAQVVGQRLAARTASISDDGFWYPKYDKSTEFVLDDLALVGLAIIGIAVAWRQKRKDVGLMLIWLGLAIAMLFIHSPLRYKHFQILLPIFAIFGGFVVSYWINHLRSWKNKPLIFAGLVVIIGLYGWHIPTTLASWQASAAVPQPPIDEVEALAFIEEMTAPDDCLIIDDMQMLYWSDRLAPPELAEVSTNRLQSGALTTPELIAITDEYDCQLVAAVTNRITKFLPDYMEWVKSKYLGRFHYGEDDLYFAKVDTTPNPARPLWGNFDNKLIFHGYSLPSASPGERVPLKLVWETPNQLDTDYAIFVQVRDTANNTLVQADHQPYKGLVPISTWPAGAVIQELTWLDLPAELPAGQYNVFVGAYDPATVERLPLLEDTSGENALILGPLVVE